MKAFSLEEYLKNPNRKVVTRDGKSVKILCTNLISDKPVVAQIEGTGYSRSYTKDGKCSLCQDSIDDLFFAPEKKEKHEGWINIYKNGNDFRGEYIYPSEKEASNEGKRLYNYIATTKIEWEE